MTDRQRERENDRQTDREEAGNRVPGRGRGRQHPLCLRVSEEPRGRDGLVEVEPRAAVRGRRQEGEGIGTSQGWSGRGVIGKARAQVGAQGGRSHRCELPPEGTVNSCRSPVGVPRGAVDGALPWRQLPCHCWPNGETGNEGDLFATAVAASRTQMARHLGTFYTCTQMYTKQKHAHNRTKCRPQAE